MKKLSIIIPCYNEEEDILDCLRSLSKQSYKDFEILIVDDGSTDKTISKIKKFDNKIRILSQNHKGPGAARNLGAKNCLGEILIFVDADMTFERNYLENLIAPIIKTEDENIIGTTHELEIVNNIENIWSRCWGKIRVSKENAKDVNIFRAIKKKKFLEMEGFDPKYGYADDQSLWFKFGVKPIVAEKTICYHKNPSTLKGVYNQSKWIGASHEVNLIKLVGMYILSPIIIPFLSLKKCYKNKEFKIFVQMIIFMTARYFGNLKGYSNKLFWKKNSK